jgi:hypothetical protein
VTVGAEIGETNTVTVDLTANPPVAEDTSAPYHETTAACPRLSR